MSSGALSDILTNVNFQSIIYDLDSGGWFQILFPFMLVYAIVFTILNNVDLFKNKKPVKVIIALVVSLFSVSFPITGDGYGGGETLGDLMMALFPGVTAFSIAILALYIVAAMLGVDLTKFLGDNNKDEKIIRYILGAIGVLVVLYYYARGFGWGGFDSSNNWFIDLITDPTLYILALFGLFFY